jgi:ribosomal protein S18 acetylase RimI-like enzyme
MLGGQSRRLRHRLAVGWLVSWQPGTQAKGIGAQLFALTCAALRAKGITYIHATIRADNVPGLAYYARMGFQDISHDPAYTLRNGTVVGRVTRQFDL